MLENTVSSNSVLLIGAGNLATSLGVALVKAGYVPVAVWSRTVESASELGKHLNCPYSNDMSQLPQAATVIISVVDSALEAVARDVARLFPNSLVLHTAGSVSVDVLRAAGCHKYGVLYPMQTFSKVKRVDFSTVTTFVEGCDDETATFIRDMAHRLGGKVFDATSEQRKYLHLAAVFACNFSNAMYAMSAQLMQKHGLPFEALLPLIDETASKVHRLAPSEAQTGPARRGDKEVMALHASMLDEELCAVYNMLSEYIMNHK